MISAGGKKKPEQHDHIHLDRAFELFHRWNEKE